MADECKGCVGPFGCFARSWWRLASWACPLIHIHQWFQCPSVLTLTIHHDTDLLVLMKGGTLYIVLPPGWWVSYLFACLLVLAGYCIIDGSRSCTRDRASTPPKIWGFHGVLRRPRARAKVFSNQSRGEKSDFAIVLILWRTSLICSPLLSECSTPETD